jgi:hypothetical protein
MDPSTDLESFLSLSSPVLWAGFSAALAIFLLMTQFRRFVLPFIAVARSRKAQSQAGEPADGGPRWTPSLQAGDRRRSYRRAGNPVPVLVVGLDGNRALDGRILDRSRGGVRVEAPLPAKVGTTLLVRSCQAPADAAWIPVTVRWCKEGRVRSHIGCQFTEELTVNTLAMFG